MMKCKQCNIDFINKRPWSKFCSKICHDNNWNDKRRAKELNPIKCLHCETLFIPNKLSGNRHQCCSAKCANSYYRKNHSPNVKLIREYETQQRELLTDRIVKRAIYISSKGAIKYNQITSEMIETKRKQIQELRFKKINGLLKKDLNNRKGPFECTCNICGKVYMSNQSTSNKCSKECERTQALRRLREKHRRKWQAPDSFECKECGKQHQPEYGDTRRTFCSLRCSNRYTRREHRKRAEEKNVYYEYVNPRKVFERDNWKCQLCGKKLKAKDRGTYKDEAPELDHIIPWACGGEHSYRNTQCACRKCNSEKGATERGQLRLFG